MQNQTSTHNRQLLLQSICRSPCMAIGRITKGTRIRSKPSTEESDREGQRQRGRPDGERRAARDWPLFGGNWVRQTLGRMNQHGHDVNAKVNTVDCGIETWLPIFNNSKSYESANNCENVSLQFELVHCSRKKTTRYQHNRDALFWHNDRINPQ